MAEEHEGRLVLSHRMRAAAMWPRHREVLVDVAVTVAAEYAAEQVASAVAVERERWQRACDDVLARAAAVDARCDALVARYAALMLRIQAMDTGCVQVANVWPPSPQVVSLRINPDGTCNVLAHLGGANDGAEPGEANGG